MMANGQLLARVSGSDVGDVSIVGLSSEVSLYFATDDSSVGSGWNVTWSQCKLYYLTCVLLLLKFVMLEPYLSQR